MDGLYLCPALRLPFLWLGVRGSLLSIRAALSTGTARESPSMPSASAAARRILWSSSSIARMRVGTASVSPSLPSVCAAPHRASSSPFLTVSVRGFRAGAPMATHRSQSRFAIQKNAPASPSSGIQPMLSSALPAARFTTLDLRGVDERRYGSLVAEFAQYSGDGPAHVVIALLKCID